jgi:hypothetical protein
MASLEQLISLLVSRKPLPQLFPKGVWKLELRKAIDDLEAHDLVKAGMHLWNDDIKLCHDLAQAHETSDGNYWHAILHRREGDLGNSLYWYRRIPEHPVIGLMQKQFPEWNAKKFIDEIEALGDTPSPKVGELETQQAAEMRFLLEHCRAS